MKQKIILPLFFFLSLLCYSCSKNDNLTANPIAGTWVFDSSFAISYAYPSLYNVVYVYGSTNSGGDVRVTFDNNHNYTFSNSIYPIDRGVYSIVQDSFLVIQPDTAALVKLNYTLPILFSGSSGGSLPPIPPPYYGFQYTSDTILFKIANNNLILSGVWLSKAATPLFPSDDTMQLNRVTNYFKKN